MLTYFQRKLIAIQGLWGFLQARYLPTMYINYEYTEFFEP